MKKGYLISRISVKTMLKAFVGLVLLVVLWRFIRGKGKGLPQNVPPVEYGSAIVANDSGTSQPFTAAMATNVADRIHQALQGMTEDEDAVFDAVQWLNGSSLHAVYVAFGVREYGSIYLFNNCNCDLFGWFDRTLSTDEKVRMRAIWSVSALPYV